MAMKQKINPLTWNFDMVSDGDSWTIKQKFNPLTWNFDMVGEWEVKMKLNPLTSNFDMVSEWGWGGWLPDAYQEVEYIEGTWTQYIDTWVSAPNWFKAELMVEITWEASQTLIGSHNVDYPYWRNNINTYTVWATRWLHMNDEMINSLWSIVIWDIYEIEWSTILWNSYLTVNWTRLTTGTNESPMSVNNVLILQNQWWLNNGDICNKAKIYSCKIYDNSEVLVRNFVPCYRKSDNVAWLYDLVEWVFYTNQGTGDFIIPSPTPPTETVIYVEVNDTDYEPSEITLIIPDDLPTNTQSFNNMLVKDTNFNFFNVYVPNIWDSNNPIPW
jgi:hypothetical protein